MFPNWAKNILFLLVYMLSGLTLVIIIEGLITGTELIPLNTAIEQGMVYLRTPLLTNILVGVTNFGSPFVLFSIACLITVLLILQRDLYNALIFIVSMIVAVASFTVLKETFQISRPGTELLVLTGWSFPSGHATVATAFFFTLAHSFFRRMKSIPDKVALVLGSILGAAVISFSRLYLGAHWALDVLAGIALGLLSVSFTILVFNVFIEDRHFGIKKKRF